MYIVDPSPIGLGALLVEIENDKVICYATRVLSDTKYSQTEKEMLAVVWAVEHFHIYLYGAQIYHRNGSSSPPWHFSQSRSHIRPHRSLEAPSGTLQLYHLVHNPGKNEKAQLISSVHTPTASEPQPASVTEEYVNYV